jgi:nucleoside-diphosphate-sugar epimerase
MNKLTEDLQLIYKEAKASFDFLKGKSLFITGATGFFGKWLLEGIQYANLQGASIELGILSRDPEKFKRNYPHLAKGIDLYQGDIETFTFPKKKYQYLIHAATPASAAFNKNHPDLMLSNIINGTQRVLAFAKECGVERILHTSSGAVYGRQPLDIDHISESFCGGPDSTDPASAYAEGKRVSELMGSIFSDQTGVDFINARCFAFVGPYQPMDAHFAIGNFIQNGLNGEDILIKGDGTPRRSYLYASDLVIWLLKILTHGQNKKAYNVGSDEYLSIQEVAQKVSKVFSEMNIEIQEVADAGQRPARYVPNINKAKEELQLKVNIDPDLAIKKVKDFYKS